MRILSTSTPTVVRLMLAMAGLALLLLASLACYALGYDLAYTGWPRSEMTLVGDLTLVLVLLLLILLAVAMIVTNLQRPGRDFWLWSAMPASMLLIGCVVEIARYGF